MNSSQVMWSYQEIINDDPAAVVDFVVVVVDDVRGCHHRKSWLVVATDEEMTLSHREQMRSLSNYPLD